MKKIIFATLMGLSAVAFASDELMTKLDTDKDGYVSEQEAAADAGVAGKFKDADANKDGKLDVTELGVASTPAATTEVAPAEQAK